MVIATGIMIAIMDMGPRPGSIPINVPIRHPRITIAMFWNENAAPKPINKPSSILISHQRKNGKGLRKIPKTP